MEKENAMYEGWEIDGPENYSGQIEYKEAIKSIVNGSK